jgi:Methylamine utilisation protein MauE
VSGPDVEHTRRVAWFRITLAAALLCGMGLSWRLWTSARLFPLSPLSRSLPAVPFPFDVLWLLALLGLLAAILAVARAKRFMLFFLVLAGALSLGDQCRWQPWFYQYFFMLAAIVPLAGRQPAQGQLAPALNACRLIVAFTYFWSGCQKLNANFFSETWPDMAGPLLQFLPPAIHDWPRFFVYLFPPLEICIGIGLLTRRLRRWAVILAAAMHVLVLAVLVAAGENTVVWPWNVAMVFFVFILFWRDEATTPRDILVPRSNRHALVALLFGVLPAFGLAGRWDSYLSMALYSGNTEQAVVYVSPAVIERLPASIRSHVWQGTTPFFLDINRWAYGELNVPVYPEAGVYRQVTARICQVAGSSPDIRLRINEKPDPWTGRRKSEFYDCNHLFEDR